VNIMQMILPMGKFMGKVSNFHGFGAVIPHFCTDKRDKHEIWRGEWTYGALSMPNFTFIGAVCRPYGQKPIFGPPSK